MEHLQQDHIDRLTHLCRLCGQRCLTKKQRESGQTPISLEAYQKDILFLYHINVDQDNKDTHSPSVCYKCLSQIRNVKRRGSQNTLSKIIKAEKEASTIWTQYDDSITVEDCGSCSHYISFNNSLFVSKRLVVSCANKHVPQLYESTESMEEDFDDCLGPEISDNSVSRDLGLNLFEQLELVEPDVHSSHRSVIEQASNEEHNTEMLMRLARALDGSTLITRGTQETYCSYQPSEPVLNEHNADRVTSRSASTPVKSIPDMSTIPLKLTPKLKTPTMVDCATSPLIKGLLNSSSPLCKSIDTPLNQREEMITTEYIRRKLKTSENKTQLRFKTKGQPLVFQKVTVPRKSSSLTTSPVRRRRAKGVEQF